MLLSVNGRNLVYFWKFGWLSVFMNQMNPEAVDFILNLTFYPLLFSPIELAFSIRLVVALRACLAGLLSKVTALPFDK